MPLNFLNITLHLKVTSESCSNNLRDKHQQFYHLEENTALWLNILNK